MESFLWACNLCAVVYLCLWSIKEDSRVDTDQDKTEKTSTNKQADEKGKRR